MTRLLLCHTCKTIDELPDYSGPSEHDVLLDHAVEAHRFPNGEEHIGKLATVPTADWENTTKRRAIEAEIKAAVQGNTGFPSEYYATRNTYQADALKCYSEHHRPKEGCIDYCDADKRLGNPTRAGWQGGPRVFLCQFCPVETWVKTQVRHQKGAYK